MAMYSFGHGRFRQMRDKKGWVVAILTTSQRVVSTPHSLSFSHPNPVVLHTEGKFLVDKLHNTTATVRLVFPNTEEAWDFVQQVAGDGSLETYLEVFQLAEGDEIWEEYMQEESVPHDTVPSYNGYLDADSIDIDDTDRKCVIVTLSFGDFNPLKTKPINIKGLVSVSDAIKQALTPLYIGQDIIFGMIPYRSASSSYIDTAILGENATRYDLLEVCSEALGASFRQIHSLSVLNGSELLNDTFLVDKITKIVEPGVRSIGSSHDSITYELNAKQPAGVRTCAGEPNGVENDINAYMGYNPTKIGGWAEGEAVEPIGYTPINSKAIRWRYNLSDEYRHGILIHKDRERWVNHLFEMNALRVKIPLSGTGQPVTLTIRGEHLLLSYDNKNIEKERQRVDSWKKHFEPSKGERAFGFFGEVKLLDKDDSILMYYGSKKRSTQYGGTIVENWGNPSWNNDSSCRFKIPLGDIFSENFGAEISIPMPTRGDTLSRAVELELVINHQYDNGLKLLPEAKGYLSAILQDMGIHGDPRSESDAITWFFHNYFMGNFRSGSGRNAVRKYASHYRVLTELTLEQGELYARDRAVTVNLRDNSLEDIGYTARIGSTPNTGAYLYADNGSGAKKPLEQLPPNDNPFFKDESHEFLILMDLALFYYDKSRVYTFDTYQYGGDKAVVDIQERGRYVRAFVTSVERNLYTERSSIVAETFGKAYSQETSEVIEREQRKKVYYHTGASDKSGGVSRSTGAGRRVR